jgi:hypothetical protein
VKTELDFWEVRSRKFISRARGEKFYRACFEFRGIERVLRFRLRRAADAIEYGRRVIARYRRLLAVAKEREA